LRAREKAFPEYAVSQGRLIRLDRGVSIASTPEKVSIPRNRQDGRKNDGNE
jgi:hypothetical protein